MKRWFRVLKLEGRHNESNYRNYTSAKLVSCCAQFCLTVMHGSPTSKPHSLLTTNYNCFFKIQQSKARSGASEGLKASKAHRKALVLHESLGWRSDPLTLGPKIRCLSLTTPIDRHPTTCCSATQSQRGQQFIFVDIPHCNQRQRRGSCCTSCCWHYQHRCCCRCRCRRCCCCCCLSW